jgi:hypothetical protein
MKMIPIRSVLWLRCILFATLCISVPAWTTGSTRRGVTDQAKSHGYKRQHLAPHHFVMRERAIIKGRAVLLHMAEVKKDKDDGKEDPQESDGWGDDTPSSLDAKSSTLQSLQQQQEQSRSQQERREEIEEPPERDLFIPIFTLVAVAGFGGLYAYETLRLYMNGELYLPGSN